MFGRKGTVDDHDKDVRPRHLMDERKNEGARGKNWV
jgi:hypothetical protein